MIKHYKFTVEELNNFRIDRGQFVGAAHEYGYCDLCVKAALIEAKKERPELFLKKKQIRIKKSRGEEAIAFLKTKVKASYLFPMTNFADYCGELIWVPIHICRHCAVAIFEDDLKRFEAYDTSKCFFPKSPYIKDILNA